MKNPRYANEQGGIMIDYDEPNRPSLYIDSGTLYDLIIAGEFGEIAAYVKPPKSDQEIIAELTSAVDQHMNKVARSKGYDSRITCAMRAGYPGPWQHEGATFGAWMDSCYAYCYQVMADAKSGARIIPTAEELIAELPVIQW